MNFTPPYRLLTLGHSYTVAANRRLAHEIALAGLGRWQVTVAAPTHFIGNDLRPVHFAPEPNPVADVVSIPAYCTRRVHLFLYGRKLRRLLAKPWDVIHAWEEPYILAGSQIACWSNPQSLLVFRSAQSLNKKYIPPFGRLERFAINRAHGWICSGSLVESNLAARPGYDLPHARIPLGVDTSAFHPDSVSGATVLHALGWKVDGPPIVGFLGRFVPEKGLELLTRALSGVSGDWRALLVGAGPMEQQIQSWAARYPDRVRVCTNVKHEQVPAYLNAMSLLCAPSQTTPTWKEQFGRMIVEAFASGLPLIASDSGEIPHVVRDSGVIVAENDVAGWSRAISDLIRDPDRRSQYAQAGLVRVQSEFAWPIVARQHLEFFEQLISLRSSQSTWTGSPR